MTLRGSVASFPLETIVQLLAATAKTGQLEVRTSAESGTLGFAEGRLVSAVSGDDTGDPALGAVFALADSDFEFVPWGEPPDPNLGGDLNQILDRAVVQRDKIVADRSIIADDRVRFVLSDRAAQQGDVRLSAEQWRALLSVNGERDLPAIAAQLKLGRLATLAMLADLVRAGIVDVAEAPPEPPPPAPGSGSGGAGGEGGPAPTASGSDSSTSRAWGEPRAEAAELRHSETPAPAAPVWEEPAAVPVWEEPAAVEERAVEPEARDEPAPARQAAVWDMPVTPPAEPDPPGWDAPAAPSSWDAPVEPAAPARWADVPVEPPPPSRWDAPVEQTRTWQPPATPTETERDWGLPAQDWERPAATADADLHDGAAPPPSPTGDRAIDDRLSALSGLFDAPAAPAPPSAWPPIREPQPQEHAAPAPVAGPAPAAPAVEEPKKKGGLFSGLFKKEEAPAHIESPATAGPVAQSGSRVTKLAAVANALLDEFNNGQYGKGRVDDRIANLLMRVDEQADPIDRPLPIVDDRIDVSTLERANMSERQVAPYLALLISQIYADAEHAFGKEKAKRGLKTVQTAVVGDAAALGTDLRLPRA